MKDPKLLGGPGTVSRANRKSNALDLTREKKILNETIAAEDRPEGRRRIFELKQCQQRSSSVNVDRPHESTPNIERSPYEGIEGDKFDGSAAGRVQQVGYSQLKPPMKLLDLAAPESPSEKREESDTSR